MSDELAPPAGAEGFDIVTNPKDPIVKSLVLPTVERMRSVGVARLTIAIREGKVAFELIPEGKEAPAPQWQLTPPGAGLWWHTKSKAEFARPHELNITRDGVLRSGMVTDNWGTFVRADELGGYWWPVPIVTPGTQTPA